MQRPDQKKRGQIIDVAARLFATRPFHEVRLEDVAAEAHIGKGTIYIYFRSKEDLYASLLQEGLTQLVERLRHHSQPQDSPAWQRIERIVQALLGFARGHRDMFQLLRAPGADGPRREMRRKYCEMVGLVGDTLRQGVQRGELSDPHPDLTALFVLACVRAAALHAPAELNETDLSAQVLCVLGHGIVKKDCR